MEILCSAYILGYWLRFSTNLRKPCSANFKPFIVIWRVHRQTGLVNCFCSLAFFHFPQSLFLAQFCHRVLDCDRIWERRFSLAIRWVWTGCRTRKVEMSQLGITIRLRFSWKSFHELAVYWKIVALTSPLWTIRKEYWLASENQFPSWTPRLRKTVTPSQCGNWFSFESRYSFPAAIGVWVAVGPN